MRLLTLARDLSRRKAREREGMFVVEGIRACEELARSPVEVIGVLSAPQLAAGERGQALRQAFSARGADVSDVTDKEFQSAAETESPQGVLAVARAPSYRFDGPEIVAQSTVRLLVLDAVQDPGNVGTLIRTAAALGADAVVALPGTVDVWNAKVVRSAMGAHFHFPAVHATWEAVQQACAAHAIVLWGAELGGTDVSSVRAPDRLALAVGNEGSGLSDPVRAALAQRITLPIRSTVESLNVAVAAGILLHQLRP
ncbi:MAG: RNA methyltransferase [Gemmatimonadota bacterium]